MTPPAKVASLSQTVHVETPELVVLSYTIAGVGSRASAAIIDYLICLAVFIALIVGMVTLGSGIVRAGPDRLTSAWAAAIIGLMLFALLWLYYVLFEALNDGQTPGKRFMRLRVVLDGGLAVTFEASAIRNLVRFVDLQPAFLYAVGMTSLVASARGKRLGDMAAGTLVVKEDLTSKPQTTTTVRSSTDTPLAIAARLSDDEYALLDRFIQRRMDFEPARRAALADGLVQQLRTTLGETLLEQQPTSVATLLQLHGEEQTARARGVAGRNNAGAARERHAIVAINAPRWAAFADRLKRIQSKGLRAQHESVVREFVQEYRELTSDLARLRTASRGTDSPELFYLNRLVASAHSLLYRRRTLRLRAVVQYLFVDVPAEIRASFRPIALAAALLFVPMIVAGRAVVVKPALAATLLPPGMLARADSGVVKAKSGQGYIEDPQMLRPLMASRLVTNNVQVAFMAFAFGMTAGVMTVWVLLMNGVSIGAAIGLYMSKGIGHLIFGFIAAHGVFELSAITIAGGAGMLLAAGMLIPGERTRGAALAANGRRAIRLIGGCCLLLVFAAAIEGFVSPNASISAAAKYAISGLTACCLVLYLVPWNRAATARRDSSAPDIDSPPAPSLSLATHPAQ